MMKNCNTFLLLMGLLCSFPSFGQSRNAVKWKAMHHNFGAVPEGLPLTTLFEFKNSGNQPLIIKYATTGCGCDYPDWRKEPIAPGKSGFVRYTYDTHHLGSFNKTLVVYFTDGEQFTLGTCGTVTDSAHLGRPVNDTICGCAIIPEPGKAKPPKDTFKASKEVNKSKPKEEPHYIKWNKTSHDFGVFRPCPLVENTFRFTNTSSKPIAVKDLRFSCGCVTGDYTKGPIMPSESGCFLYRYDGKSPGSFQKTATITFDDGEIFQILISGEVSDSKQLKSAQSSEPCTCGNLNKYADTKDTSVNTRTGEHVIQVSGPSFSIYPNPFEDVLHLGVNLPSAIPAIIEITDMQGRCIKTLVQNGTFHAGVSLYEYNLDALAPGIFMIRVVSEGHVIFHEKIVKLAP